MTSKPQIGSTSNVCATTSDPAMVAMRSLVATSRRSVNQIISYLFDFAGAARGIRTPDPLITNEVLYQLSYCGISMG